MHNTLNIYLEKFKTTDLDNYYRLVRNFQVMKMITERELSFDEAKSRFDNIIKENQLHSNFGYFKIIEINTNAFIGLAKLSLANHNAGEAELGYMLLPEFWKKGIASYVTRILISKAKNKTAIQKIFAIIDPKNTASKKILINNRFVSVGFKDFDGLPGEIFELVM